MIIIRKLKKVNEILSDNEKYLYPIEETEKPNYYKFTTDSGKDIIIYLNVRESLPITILDIEYARLDDRNKKDFTPAQEKYTTEKFKIINTVVNFCKRKINEINPTGIFFSGENDSGLSDFYKILIKNIKVENYDVIINDNSKMTTFSFIKKDFTSVYNDGELLLRYDDRLILYYLESNGIIFVESLFKFGDMTSKIFPELVEDFKKYFEYINFSGNILKLNISRRLDPSKEQNEEIRSFLLDNDFKYSGYNSKTTTTEYKRLM